MKTTTTEPILWAVHKASRTYDGGSYSGPSLIVASLPPGPYDSQEKAQWVANRLLEVNPVGWEITPYRPRKQYRWH